MSQVDSIRRLSSPSWIARMLPTLAAIAVLSLAACERRRENDPPPAAAVAEFVPATAAASGLDDSVVVYKSPTCGCCTAWVDHMRENGFRLVVRDTADVTPIKVAHGVAEGLASCHTALVDGYVLEGHVPATDVQRLLRERPTVAGLAVPGMPAGSRGMEGPIKQPYDVVMFDRSGRRSVVASH